MRTQKQAKKSQPRRSSILRRSGLIETLEQRRVLTVVPFAESIVFNDGISRSQVVQTADLDGDGDQDAIALSANELLTFLNDGSGAFGDPIKASASLPGDTRSLTLQDFDGDGDVDAIAGAVGNEEEDHSTVAMFTNDGSGNLDFASTLLTSVVDNFVDDITSGDIDNDGDMDVVAVGRGSSQIFLLKNTGDGGFEAPVVITGDFLEPRAAHITDMDGDGDMDIVATSSFDDPETDIHVHNVFWFENTDGAGAFGQNPAGLVDTGAEPRFMDSADVDGDGDMDLVVPLQGSNELVLIENSNGLGALSAPLILAAELDGVERARFGDVDGDQDLDIVANIDAAGQVIWLENTDGMGAYSDVKFVSEDTDQASGLSLTDLDGDGDLDAMTTSQFAAKVSTHINDGSGTFVTTELTPDNAIDPELVFLADLDGDGDQDVIGQSEFDYELAWYENAGDGTFGGQNMIVDYDLPPDGTPTVWWDIVPADMDGDGDIDIVTSEPNRADKIIWYENVDGKGDFSELHTHTGLTNEGVALIPLELSVVDIDGDGDNDILANQVGYYAGIGWYENTDGEGTIQSRSLIAIDGHADRGRGEHSIGDIDGDGDMDVLVGDNNSNTTNNVVWYENVAGVFDEVQILKADQANIDDVKLIDMDDDGDLDAVTASYPNNDSDSLIEWFANTDGAGTFSATGTVIGDQFIVTELYIVDVDADGDKDVVAPGLNEGLIEVFDNNGDGTFSEYSVNSTPFGLTAQIGVGDISGDGRIDVVVGKGSDNAYLAYIAQEGAGKFDLDVDGDVDGDDALALYGGIRASSDDVSLDLNGDGVVSNLDMITMMDEGLGSSVGDSNFDGTFGTADLVIVFQASEYEDGVDGNSTWATGDWNVDGDFTTLDLVFVFQHGKYDRGVAGALPKANGDVAGAIDTDDQRADEVAVDEAAVVEIDDNGIVAELDVIEVDQLFNRDDRDLVMVDDGNGLENVDVI